jgi:hypothetical protein
MNTITEKLKTHTTLSFQMLTNLIAICPEEHWYDKIENDSICKRMLHTLESIDYWFLDFSVYHFKFLFDDLSAEMDHVNDYSLSKNEILGYADLILLKIEVFFSEMNDGVLLKNSSIYTKLTFLDIILSQIRHIQINVGYCNEKFSSKGLKSSEWLGYNEESEKE